MCFGLHVNYLYSCPILMKFEYSQQFFDSTQISNSMKICPMGAEFCCADRRTDMMKLSHFSQFCEHA